MPSVRDVPGRHGTRAPRGAARAPRGRAGVRAAPRGYDPGDHVELARTYVRRFAPGARRSLRLVIARRLVSGRGPSQARLEGVQKAATDARGARRARHVSAMLGEELSQIKAFEEPHPRAACLR